MAHLHITNNAGYKAYKPLEADGQPVSKEKLTENLATVMKSGKHGLSFYDVDGDLIVLGYSFLSNSQIRISD